MSSGNFERINQSNRGELKRVQDKKGGIKEELGDAPEEIVVNMLPLLQRRLPTTSAFTASDTEALLPNGDGDVNARTSAIMKLIQYSCGGVTTSSIRMRRLCAERNKEFVRNCVESGRKSGEGQPAHRTTAPRAVRWGEEKADAECVALTPLEILQNAPEFPPPVGKECDAITLHVKTLQSDVLTAIQCTHINTLTLAETTEEGEFLPFLDILYRLHERTKQFTPMYYNDILQQISVQNSHPNLSSQFLGDSGVIALCRVGVLNRVETINLSINNIRRLGAEAIAKGISSSSSLTSIDLHGNDFRGDRIANMTGVKALAHAMSVSKSLTSIDLHANDLGAEGGKAIAGAISVSKSLTSINLFYNKLGPKGAKALGPAISMSKSLTSVDLGLNQFGAEGAKPIAEAISVSESLTTINLECNRLGPEGAKALGPVIGNSKSLTSINLEGNKLGLDGGKAIAEAISFSKSLTSIDLRYNQIGPEGANALGPEIGNSKSLTSINLEGNKLGPEGAKALGLAISVSKSLTSIDLSENRFGPAGGKAIAKAISASKFLTSINLSRNNLDAECRQTLGDAVREKADFTLNV